MPTTPLRKYVLIAKPKKKSPPPLRLCELFAQIPSNNRQLKCHIHRSLNLKRLPHRSPKSHSSFKGAIVLKDDEAAVLAESGEIGLVSLKDEEATMKR